MSWEDRITVRELRAKFRTLIEQGKPLIVGSYWHKKCIVLPVPKHDQWDKGQKRKARAEMRRQAKVAIAEVFEP